MVSIGILPLELLITMASIKLLPGASG